MLQQLDIRCSSSVTEIWLFPPPPSHSLAPRGPCPPALPTMKYLLPLSHLFNSILSQHYVHELKIYMK